MLVRDLSQLQLEGPAIPDPERTRLLRHAENSRGGMPIFALEPGIDQKWADWQSRWADEQVRFRNLVSTFTGIGDGPRRDLWQFQNPQTPVCNSK